MSWWWHFKLNSKTCYKHLFILCCMFKSSGNKSLTLTIEKRKKEKRVTRLHLTYTHVNKLYRLKRYTKQLKILKKILFKRMQQSSKRMWLIKLMVNIEFLSSILNVSKLLMDLIDQQNNEWPVISHPHASFAYKNMSCPDMKIFWSTESRFSLTSQRFNRGNHFHQDHWQRHVLNCWKMMVKITL